MKRITFYTLIALCLLALPASAQTTLLHEFAGAPADGGWPRAALVISGSTLYGMTFKGGDSDYGTIFRVETDGTLFSILHEFAGGADDGRYPYGSLVLSGSTLYGMTTYGGDNEYNGTVFKIETNGTGFTLLREFAGGANDGKYPYGSLVLSGSTLYGMTAQGGDSDGGTIFRMETDGTLFSLLHEFTGSASDGGWPYGSLVLFGSTLYGMTYYGGDSDIGTIFKIQTNGTGFSLLHEFAGGAADGSYPYYGALILSGSTLYGMTREGGDDDRGTVFKIQTNGTGFALLHEFSYDIADGATPYSSLLQIGSTLYGTTLYGGAASCGTVFRIQADGSGFALVHEFAGGGDDGETPFGSLVLSSSTLYGMTGSSGDSDLGVVYSLPVPATRDDFIGTWDSQGVYYRNSLTGLWVKLATPATLISAGDLDGDGIDDLIGIWPGQGGVWVKYSQSGTWAKLSTTARDISAGDMNGDGRVDLVATWDGQGVYYRNSIGGAWVQMATPAEQVTAGDLDGDGKADVIGIWPSQGGIWVKYSQSGSWAKLSTTAIDIACGDMNGDGRDDLLATWDGNGVYFRNSLTGLWVKLATPATLVAAGDLDGDLIDDLIGIWPGQGGVWVKYSQTGSWAKLSSTARHIAAGLMRGGAGAAEVLAEPSGGFAEAPGNFGYQDLSEAGPGGMRFLCREEENLFPLEDRESALRRMPGPDEYGFQCLEQENLIPGSGTTKEPEGKEQRKQP